jgi:pyrroline-5-carboxylate reductase
MQIAIIGCGTMGSGLAQRLSETCRLCFYDRNSEKAKKLEKAGYGKAYKGLKDALQGSEWVILAIKPQNLKEASEAIRKELKKDQILVSILAGISTGALKGFFPGVKIVRMMPNLALIYGEGVIGLSSQENLSQKDQEALTRAFEHLGKIYWLPESKIEGLAALAGSGPAFVFTLVEAMIDAGVAMGFAAKDARDLVCQMLQGSLTLLEKTEKHPGELKWQITSPQGTTIAGLRKLEESAVRGGIMNTFLAAYERSKELH